MKHLLPLILSSLLRRFCSEVTYFKLADKNIALCIKSVHKSSFLEKNVMFASFFMQFNFYPYGIESCRQDLSSQALHTIKKGLLLDAL
jgi:hypothetical protein